MVVGGHVVAVAMCAGVGARRMACMVWAVLLPSSCGSSVISRWDGKGAVRVVAAVVSVAWVADGC